MGWYNGFKKDCSCECPPVEPTECPCCNFSWDTSIYTGDFLVDLGVGGWVDEDCNYCDQVAGEFTLSSGGYNCGPWTYGPTEVCTLACDGTKNVFLRIVLTLVPSNFPPPPCYAIYDLSVSLYYNCDLCDCGPQCASGANFISGAVDVDTCLDELDEDDKMTLDKTLLEGHEIETSHCTATICSGALATPVEVWREEI